MKKIVMMFAVAAMMVACGPAKKTATPEQLAQIKDSLYNAQLAEAQKAIGEAPVLAELPEDATEEMKAAAQAEFDSLTKVFTEKLNAVTVDSTTEAFKAALAEEVKKFEEALNAPAEEKKEGEQAAEGEQK